MAFNFSLLSLIVFKLSIFNGIEWYQAEPPSSHTQQLQYNTEYYIPFAVCVYAHWMFIYAIIMFAYWPNNYRQNLHKRIIDWNNWLVKTKHVSGCMDVDVNGWDKTFVQFDQCNLLFVFFHFFHWVFKKSIWNFSQRK